MFELRTRLGDADLIQPNRAFIKEGELTQITKYSDTGKQIRLFLFNDLLIVAKEYSIKCKIPLVASKVEVHRSTLQLCFGSYEAEIPMFFNTQVHSISRFSSKMLMSSPWTSTFNRPFKAFPFGPNQRAIGTYGCPPWRKPSGTTNSVFRKFATYYNFFDQIGLKSANSFKQSYFGAPD